MPCSCFGKKDKKGGGPLKKEDEGYHPGDFRERDPLVKAGSGLTPPFAEVKKQQQQQQLGSAPPAPVTPPSTPSAGETRLRPEDDTDKATRRRDVVASFYSDQCELIGFKTTGSRPSSAHVGGGHHDGPAATSSPATSSPSSTRSAGACCRADLAEKRREFFKDLANDDFRGSRPTSRLTDPGSQQTPRNSHYQEQLHHTLPHHNKTSRSNLVSSHPLVLALGIHRNSNPVSSSNSEENQNFSLQSSPSPEQAPKMLRVNPDLSVSKNLNHPSNEVVSEYKLHDDISSKTPLLSGNEEASQIICDTSMSTTVQKCSPEISHNSVDQSFPGTEHISMESKSPELINVHPTEITVDKVEIKSSDTDSFLSTEPFGSVRTSVVNSPDVICDMLVTENSKSVDAPSDSKKQFHVMDAATSQNPQLTLGSSCNGGQEMGMDVSVPESDPFIDNEDLTFVVDNSQMTFSSANVNPFAQFGTPDSVVESYSGECVVTPESLGDHQFSNKFSHETQLQTDLFDNKALKDSLPKEYEHSSFEVIPQMEEGPQTIVETTRQFISASSESPIQPNNSQTIVETTRQFITGPPEEQATKTIVEVTRQFPPENSDELKSSQTIVETTRQFISGIPEDEQTPFILEDAAQQFMSEISGNQINVKTTENFVSGSPDGRITHTIVQTTQHLVSGSPDEQVTQTVVESSEQLFPSSNDKFFLTSVEELDDIPEKFMLQTGSATVTSSSTVTEKPVLSTRTQLTDLSEEKDKPQLPDVPCFGVPPPPPSPPSPFEEDPFSEDLFTSPVTVPITPVEGEPMPPVPPLSNVEPESPQFTSSVFDEEKDFSEFSSASFELPLPQHDNQEKEILDTPSRPNLEDLQQLLPSSSPSPPLLSKENKQLSPTSTPTEDNFLPTPPTPPTEKKMEATLLSSSICTTTTTNTTVSSTPNVTCGVEIVSTSTLDDDGLGSEIDDALESIEGLSEEGNNIGRAAASS